MGTPTMLRHHYRPQAPLAAFVPSLLRCATGHRPRNRERVLPTATTELVIDLSDTATRPFDVIVCGPHSTFFEIERRPNTVILSAHFPPGCAFPFFGVPADVLHNAVVPLRALWGRDAEDLHQLLLTVPTADQVRILDRWLCTRASATSRHPSVTAALAMLRRAPQLAVAELADHIGLRDRQLARVFAQHVGMTPKRFARVRRFQASLHRIDHGVQVDWAALAARSGYSDQAHFNHDFRAFSGLTPSAYLCHRGPQLNHVALPA